MTHPYKNLEDYRFWFKAVSDPAPGHIDPVTRFKAIQPGEKIATMGSCFAQHLSAEIVKANFNYFVSESAPSNIDSTEARRRNYGVFSARYGNVYTIRQAVQLFDRAYGLYEPDDNIWARGSSFVDGFRPQIEPDGFPTRYSLLEDRAVHLKNVRRIFEQSDWLIFTLGLTEAWRSKVDGSVFPVAPGVSGGDFDPNVHEFVNFSVSEVASDLGRFIEKCRSVNSSIKFILTVSPVPLIATYEKRHVLASTVLSKSVLRVAADEAERRFDDVIYFPSYEIITSPANGGRYYADDLRQVTALGVNHVMRMFAKHFIFEGGPSVAYIPADSLIDEKPPTDVICDEEAIMTAVKRSGF